MAMGFAVGYYYGAKAGRERFDQIEHYLGRVRSSPVYHQVVNRLGEVAEAGMGRGRVLVSGVSATGAPTPATANPFDYVGDPTLN